MARKKVADVEADRAAAQMAEDEARAVVDHKIRAAAGQAVSGPLSMRIESACDAVMSDALGAFAGELGGRGAGSKAIRLVLQKGFQKLSEERSAG